ncbi:unnamed protein product [Rotaria sordida]|uniref:Uncharacterized protein n=1 Tax=Rotaria sordida TaxID=392033 RepID=A0A818SEV2_9BILA|nr:unnamed protein product [Rotaria sordida]
MIGPIADAERLYEQSFQDIISLTFPLYYIRIPAVNQVRSNVLLEFYEKYKYLGNASMLEDYMEYGLSLMNYDVDLVPALKLEFWPDDMQVFLNRIQNSRPKLYEIILEQASMHLIPKWSSKTQEVDQELEFRYSFSAIERLLAKNRTRVEQILNGVARSIYYRCLKKEPCLEDHTKTIVPSYFIKTTVLWMCELYNLNDLCSETDDDQTIANIMATEWLNYVREKLCSGYCPHYFIDSFNLLETCSLASLTRAASILEHEVRLHEDIEINVLIKQDELMDKQQQTTENWLQNMKVKDILAAVNDYRLMRENWLCPPEKNQDEGDVSDCFYTLSQLRALDGDKQQNWNTYQRLFLTVDQSTWLPPIWDEQVAECSVCDFVDGLIALGSFMKQILEGMKKSDIEQTMARNSREMEFFSTQNLVNDLIQPGNIVQNGLMTSWLPMFTSSYFNQSLTNVPSIRQRSIIANHPTGPLQDLLQGRTCPTPLDPQSRQTYQQYAQNASYRFLDLLSDAPNIDMTLGDLLTYYDRPPRTNEPVITSSIEEQILLHATNSSSVKKESITLIVFDPNLTMNNITDEEYRTINDYVLIYGVKSQLLTYVQSISEESIFIILCQSSSDEEFLSQLNDLNQIHSIFIYSVQQVVDDQLTSKYSKVIGTFTEQKVLLEQVRTSIEQPFALRFGFYDPQQQLTMHTKLSKESLIFFWNLLLKDLLMTEQPIDRSFLIQDCREYYRLNTVEMENIEQFEKTYDSRNPHEWIIINLGVTFKLNSLDFDDKLGIWIARLVFSHEGVQIAQNYVAVEQQTMERMTLPLIIANLLLKMNDLSMTKNYLDSLKNEDEALIHHYYGNLHYKKGEYELALENFQIAYELMIGDGRIQDSALVLHDIGYVYDRKKEFNDALDSHRKALEIRQTYCPTNDARIGISLYNIGRTLVNIDDNSQALIYHQKALEIFENTLTYNHVYSILLIQLSIAFGLVASFQFIPNGRWLYFTLFGSKNAGRKFPLNLILLAIVTLSMGYMMGMISVYYKIELVLIAVGITTFVCFAMVIEVLNNIIDSMDLIITLYIILAFIHFIRFT